MNCPGCEGELVARSAGGLTLQRCARCGGLWVDNEGSQLLHAGALPDAARALVLEVEKELAADSASGDRPGGARACPMCAAAMSEVEVPLAKIAVDVCAQHGTYFDRHELVRFFQAVEIKNVDDAEAAEAYGKEVAGDRMESALRGSVLSTLFGWLRR